MKFNLDEYDLTESQREKSLPTHGSTPMFADPTHQYFFEEITKLKEVIEKIKDQIFVD